MNLIILSIYFNYVKQQKKQIYICEVCSKKFDSPINCLDHIAKDHNLPTPSTSNEVNEKLNILTNLHILIILFYF